MKLKYKKMILLTTMSTMGIGLLTLSVSKGSSKADETKRAGSANEVNTMAMGDTVDADDISTKITKKTIKRSVYSFLLFNLNSYFFTILIVVFN
jgi:hypothetical protein